MAIYMMAAPENYNKFGVVFGHIHLVDGICLVDKQYWWNFLKQRGFQDITPANWEKSFAKPDELKRVLHIHYSGYGDMLFLTPVFKAFGEKHPDTIQHLATGAGIAPVTYQNPYLDAYFLENTLAVPHYVEEYNDVINYDTIIASNRESELKNCYDLVEEWAGIAIPDEQKKPDIYLSDTEKAKAKEEFAKKYGVGPDDKIVIIQYSASSSVRSIEIMTAIKTGQAIAEQGYKVFLFGNQPNLSENVFLECPRCGKELRFVTAPTDVNVHTKCIHCQNEMTINCAKKGAAGIQFLEKYDIRAIMALIYHSSYFIGVDSCGLHIAAAFDIPSLGIFASFDADLRLRYYPKTRWIQKQVGCGPCFLHTGLDKPNCRKAKPGKVSPCMQMITVDEIVSEFEKMAKGELWEKPAPFKPIQSIRPCPVCGETKKRKFICRKGQVCYYECPCQAIYTDQEVPTVNNGDSYYEGFLELYSPEYVNGQKGSAKVLHKKCYREGKINKVLDVGCGIATVLNELQHSGWYVLGLDYSSAARQKNQELYPTVDVISEDFFTLTPEESFSLIWMNNVFEHMHQPRKVFEKAWDLLEPDSIFAMQIPDGDIWREKRLVPRWDGVNNSYAGEHSVIHNQQTLCILAEKTGFIPVEVEEVPGPDCLWMYFKKNGSWCPTCKGTKKFNECVGDWTFAELACPRCCEAENEAQKAEIDRMHSKNPITDFYKVHLPDIGIPALLRAKIENSGGKNCQESLDRLKALNMQN